MNQELFAIRLKKLRESMHLTQNQFGALLNIAQTTLSSYEKGSKTPNIDTLCNIAEKCNVSIDWLCGRTDLKNVENFNTYSEVFQAIVKVCKNVKFSIIEDSNVISNNDISQNYLEPGNAIVNDFFDRWRKVKEIYDDKTIDDETYESVVNSIINRYKHIKIIYDDNRIQAFNSPNSNE